MGNKAVTCRNRNPVAGLVSFLPQPSRCPSAVPSSSPAPGCCLDPSPLLARSWQCTPPRPLAELTELVSVGPAAAGWPWCPSCDTPLAVPWPGVPSGLAISTGPPALSTELCELLQPSPGPPLQCSVASRCPRTSTALSKGCDSL